MHEADEGPPWPSQGRREREEQRWGTGHQHWMFCRMRPLAVQAESAAVLSVELPDSYAGFLIVHNL
jgi:hypothetical protein